MDNSFDVTLEDEDYTFGKVIDISYIISFIGQNVDVLWLQEIPSHDSFSVIRMAFPNETDRDCQSAPSDGM